MPDCTATREVAAGHSAWQASLALQFSDDAGTTRLTGNAHYGPLRVQKSLHPEGAAVCHAIIVHPPGGVVGGDQLAIEAAVGAGAHALLTTPGAAKWYKANGKVSRQQVRLSAAAGAALEWLPQETIFYDHADVVLDQHVELAADATYIGGEIVCMGRRASGESFSAGKVTQRTQIRRGGKLIWWEQGVLTGGALDSPLTLDGKTVCATLIAVGKPLPAALLTDIRNDVGNHIGGGIGGRIGNDIGNGTGGGMRFGVTQTKGVLVARHLGDDSEAARHVMLAVWRRLRPHLLDRAAVVPRIWRT